VKFADLLRGRGAPPLYKTTKALGIEHGTGEPDEG
jgi:hypothetical protein